ncbi:hypothetical protein BUALT_Bualt16G0053000 [Buddleja alternifolia]|uniref:Cyclic nucleotide-binding domain-containing protein n=1 Tax=Buddleja alternifolia TaxID=168488 RepID=A0AAV6WEP3_9LAMI|nr:hypothetical protein BUALT_Bualt16G0053000 [Buddleja alternifolia]
MVITEGANGLFIVTGVEDAIGVLACSDTFDAAHFNASRVTRITAIVGIGSHVRYGCGWEFNRSDQIDNVIFLKTWKTILVLLAAYNALVCPFEFGFCKKPMMPLIITDSIVNVFFGIDIVLTFFIAFLDKATHILVHEKREIALKYATSWLIPDIISTFLAAEIAPFIFPKSLWIYGLVSMFRLSRIRRVGAFFTSSFCWLLVLWSCCSQSSSEKTWIGDLHQSLLTRYISAIYLSMTTLATVGYGDLHAANIWEMIFCILDVLFNLGLTAYVLGNMTHLVAHGARETQQFRDTIQAASHFARRNQLQPRLGDPTLSHLCLQSRIDSEVLQQQEALVTLPKVMRSRISHSLFYSQVENVYLLRGFSEMKPEYFPPREDIILQNEVPMYFYMLVTGAMDLLVMQDDHEHASLICEFKIFISKMFVPLKRN